MKRQARKMSNYDMLLNTNLLELSLIPVHVYEHLNDHVLDTIK